MSATAMPRVSWSFPTFRDDRGPFRRGVRLSPYDPQNPVWSNFLAVAEFFAGEAKGALVTSAHALGTRPDWRPIVETVPCCYAATGK